MSIGHVGVENTCYTQLLQSEECITFKHSGIILLTALGAIGMATALLITMARQGYDLAGINTLSQMIPTKWFYIGVGVIGVTSMLASVLFAAQVANHLRPY